MKKICAITTISKTVESFAVDYYTYMAEVDDYDVTIVSDYDDGFQARLAEDIRFHPIGMDRGVSFKGIRTIFEMYRFFKEEDFDLVQYSTPNASLYASFASFLAGVPVRLYCQWGIYYVSHKGIARFIFKTIEKIVCRLSTHIQPDSYGNLHFSRQEGLYGEEKSSVVWNGSASGVDLEKFDIERKDEWRQQIRQQYAIPEEAFFIGFIGRITKDKGVYELLTMLKALVPKYPNLYVMIAGDFEDPNLEQYPAYQWSLEQDRIIYPGRISGVERYYAAMDLFVLPSYREGFGTVIIEAEAMGVPVVVTDIPGPTEAMLPGESGLVVAKESSQALIDAVEWMIQHPQEAEAMGRKGRDYAATHFDKKILNQKVHHNRNQLIEQAGRA
ncbi:glycosyltransferase family 4 protein [Aerococcaceae bacterium DSM 111020]|nr:glycosyltransferase family 4 protein [Aerococcaceae bacterium DSM 111020]